MSDDRFLTPEERGNPAIDIAEDGSWSNLVRLLIHGATYFRRLYEELCASVTSAGMTPGILAIRSRHRSTRGTATAPPGTTSRWQSADPSVWDLLHTFIERWDDPHPPYAVRRTGVLVQRLTRMPRHTSDLPEAFQDPAEAGRSACRGGRSVR